MSLQPKTYDEALKRRIALQTRQREKAAKAPSRKPLSSKRRQSAKRKPIRRAGKKGKAWSNIWRWLKAELEKRGRTKCEFHFIAHECSRTLTPAHSKKRRMIQGDEIYHVAIACSTVHQILDERMAHEAMEAAVMRAINENGGLILP